MIFDLKVKIAVWAFVALMWGISILAAFGIWSLKEDLKDIPVLMDKVKHNIEWMRL